MTLYMNRQMEPKVYKTKVKLKDIQNQKKYRVNYLEEFMKEQQQLNGQITDSYHKISNQMQSASLKHNNHFNNLLRKMDKQESRTTQFINKLSSQETPIQNILERLEKLDSIHQTLVKEMAQDELTNQAIMDQLSAQDQAINKLSQKIVEYESIYQEIFSQQTQQTELYNDMMQKLQLQEAFHKTILDELSKQEAVNQKISGQIDSIKEMIIDKVTTILEKIESTYKSTSNYLFSFFGKPTPKLLEKEDISQEKKQVN
jgi:DNA-binding FrmR family transcriptional regulator